MSELDGGDEVAEQAGDVLPPGLPSDPVAAVGEAAGVARAARARLVAATVAAVRAGALSEVAAAREAGVDRHTVRGWLGKGRRRG